jgi:hypothetical protein
LPGFRKHKSIEGGIYLPATSVPFYISSQFPLIEAILSWLRIFS